MYINENLIRATIRERTDLPRYGYYEIKSPIRYDDTVLCKPWVDGKFIREYIPIQTKIIPPIRISEIVELRGKLYRKPTWGNI